jgi:3-dehydroquinate synthase
MQSIRSTDYYVHFQDVGYAKLKNYLNAAALSKVILLVDENTDQYCLAYFLKQMGGGLVYDKICIPSGEEHKNLGSCEKVWKELTEMNADRKSLIINLGGGVITDMGGFIASCFKRGIRFVNIPTTLLSMVDASVGGKTGVDLGALKNIIGIFSNPEMVIIDPYYLNTLSERELKSGLAEIIKYGITFDQTLWAKIKQFDSLELSRIEELIYRSIEIKNDVVLTDLKETGLRKALNFGHTLGHALESFYLENEHKKTLTHGEAIAVGMVIELYYSTLLFSFPKQETDAVKQYILKMYGRVDIKKEDFDSIIALMIYDKKNVSGKVNFVLLEDYEKCLFDINLNEKTIRAGLQYYLD